MILPVPTGCVSLSHASAKVSSLAGASAWALADGRLHLQHGPIDLLVDANGDSQQVQLAYEQAVNAFESVLQTLVDELESLQTPITERALVRQPEGPVAQRMLAAVNPYCGVFVTPMIAVAGSVADYILQQAMTGRQLDRLAVNNGGDIALALGKQEVFRVGITANPDVPRRDAHIVIDEQSGIGGIATSGWRGRSHSLGIADAVTVLAKNAASADVAATLIANAVDAPYASGVSRHAAHELNPDSDLGDRPVTVAVGELDDDAIALAIRSGVHMAEQFYKVGRVSAVYINLKDVVAVVGDAFPLLESVDGAGQDS